MIQAQKLQQSFYAFPLTVEAPLIPKSISIYEPTTAEEQSDQSYYHPFILSELHELFTFSKSRIGLFSDYRFSSFVKSRSIN